MKVLAQIPKLRIQLANQRKLLFTPPPLDLFFPRNRIPDIAEALKINQPRDVIPLCKPLDNLRFVLHNPAFQVVCHPRCTAPHSRCISYRYGKPASARTLPRLHNPSGGVCLSNAFVFFQFRTFVHDRNVLNPFPSNTLRTTFVITEGWGMLSALIPNPEPLVPVLSFQQDTTVKFCNSCLLITIRIARGVGSPLCAGVKVSLEVTLPRRIPSVRLSASSA